MEGKLKKNLLGFLLGLAAVTAVTVVAGLVRAGDLEPSAAPAPTFKTLNEIPPTWSQILPADDGDPVTGCDSSRFDCVMGGDAVLDKETGLVWQQRPAATVNTWVGARFQCTFALTGLRRGWRAPSVHELASLLDPNNPLGNPDLPPGHPFSGVSSDIYWSATTNAANSLLAWIVNFNGSVEDLHNKTDGEHVWCVRGDMNASQY